MAQGCILSEIKVRKIINLLSRTDMTVAQIAARMGCSRTAVLALNRKFQVRKYAGRRTKWSVQTIN